MRAGIHKKPLRLQEVTASHYRCVSIRVTRLTRSQQIPSHSLVLKKRIFGVNIYHLIGSKYYFEISVI